ncbi:secretin receptor [Trichinella spiralis]|uniref:secretin receptor n=1 Tax=Trichinella spiralis TaxID=6334 RepID=UPI0001EFC634|nr:secretin receptor [Trichinella spiralis]
MYFRDVRGKDFICPATVKRCIMLAFPLFSLMTVLCWNGKRNFHLSAICLHPTGDGQSKVEAMLKALKEDVEESERLREKRNLMKKSMEIQKKQSLWLRFKNEMQHYYHGFKLLYIDVKVCLRLLRRLLTGETLMRKERRQLIRTTSDLFRLVPFLIFIIVPFMEFALPLVLKFFPGLLPSTFQEEHKEQEKRNKALKVKLDMAKFLQDTLEDLSLERKKNSDGLNQLTEFSAFMKKIREEGGSYVSNDDLLKYSKFFEDELTLDSLSYAQLRALCLIVGIQPIGTTNMLLLQLRLKLRELKADDQLIVKEGIDSLSESELQTACRARGMRALGVPVSRLKAQLAKWLELSLNEKVPPSLLLLSSTLYIQEDVPFSVRLKTILSTLPSHIADEAKIKLAEIEGVRVDNKTKFDLIVSLEEALKKEAEEQRSKQKEKGVAQKATVVRSPTEEVEAVVQAASVPVTESDVLLDSAPLVKDKSIQIDTPIESSELREIEHLVETVKGPLNEVKDDLIELKEQVQEHKEEVEEVQSIFKSRGDDVKVSKAARRLQSQVDRLVERVDKLVDRMEGKKIIATVDEKQTDPSAIAKHEKKMATLSEVLAPLKQLKQMPNEAKMKRIYQVLEAFDEDRDGAIDLDLALKVIDLMMKESVEINSEQVNKALEILKKEEDLLGESATSDSVEKKSINNGKGLHQSKLAHGSSSEWVYISAHLQRVQPGQRIGQEGPYSNNFKRRQVVDDRVRGTAAEEGAYTAVQFGHTNVQDVVEKCLHRVGVGNFDREPLQDDGGYFEKARIWKFGEYWSRTFRGTNFRQRFHVQPARRQDSATILLAKKQYQPERGFGHHARIERTDGDGHQVQNWRLEIRQHFDYLLFGKKFRFFNLHQSNRSAKTTIDQTQFK